MGRHLDQPLEATEKMNLLDHLRMLYPPSPVRQVDAPILLVRPDPATFQCRQDHLMEIAEKNTLAGIRDLCEKLRGSFMILAIAKEDELRAFTLGQLQPSKGLRRCSSTSSELRLFGLGNPSKVCPACLKDGLPVTHYTNYALTMVCRRHNLLLVDQCPHCEKDICYMRPHKERCEFCRKSLAYLEFKRAPSWLKKFRDVFAPWDDDHFSLPRSLSDYAFARLFHSYYYQGAKWVERHPRICQRHLEKLEELANNYKELLPIMVKHYIVKRAPLVPDLRNWTAADTKANAIIQDFLSP